MSNDKPKTKPQKIIGIILNALTYIFFAICLVALVFSIAAKRDVDGAVNFGGKQMRIVLSDSMGKCDQTDVSGYEIKDIPVKSMIFIELAPEDEQEKQSWYADLEVGDVVTFRYVYVTQETITHRIISKTENENGGYTIVLEGDNKNSDTNTLTQTIDTSKEDSPNYIIGKVTGKNYLLGVLITAVKSPVGIICIVIIPCVIIAIFEVFRLISALTENRRKKEREEQKKKDDELEELKRQLAALQKADTSAQPKIDINNNPQGEEKQ